MKNKFLKAFKDDQKIYSMIFSMQPLFLCLEAFVGFKILLITRDYFMLKLHKREISVTLLPFLRGPAQKQFTRIIDNYKLKPLL